MKPNNQRKIRMKLVRDKIPEIIKKDNGKLVIKIEWDIKYKSELIKKIKRRSWWIRKKWGLRRIDRHPRDNLCHSRTK